MKLKLSSNNIDDYLKESSTINYSDIKIQDLALELKKKHNNEIDLIKASFEYVRDVIPHSIDISGDTVTLKASEVLTYKEGFCYAKSHLLAALLRANSIPTGFCYQRLILNNETKPYLVLHGLNAVYISSHNKWIRLDARGNKEGVNAQFNLNQEQLAFPIDKSLGEEDILIIFTEPDQNVVEKLSKYTVVSKLLDDLPKDLRKNYNELSNLEIITTTSQNKDFINLIKLLDKDLNERYGAKQSDYDKHNKVDVINDVIVIYDKNTPLACGAFKKYNHNTVELKRVFVIKEARNQGLAKLIVGKLENLAKEKGFISMILETGKKQYEAIKLYKSLGYEEIENYEPYVGIENSICMKKEL